MNEIGNMPYEGGIINVYEENGRYFHRNTFMTEDDDIDTTESRRFDSLENLLATLPRALRFNPIGQDREEYVILSAENAEEDMQRQIRFYQERKMRIYGTTNWDEILKIQKERESRATQEKQC